MGLCGDPDVVICTIGGGLFFVVLLYGAWRVIPSVSGWDIAATLSCYIASLHTSCCIFKMGHAVDRRRVVNRVCIRHLPGR